MCFLFEGKETLIILALLAGLCGRSADERWHRCVREVGLSYCFSAESDSLVAYCGAGFLPELRGSGSSFCTKVLGGTMQCLSAP